jgi:hypothetical protein
MKIFNPSRTLPLQPLCGTLKMRYPIPGNLMLKNSLMKIVEIERSGQKH